MGFGTDLFGLVRGRLERSVLDRMEKYSFLTANPRGELSIAQALPPLTDLSRQRRGFWTQTTSVAPAFQVPVDLSASWVPRLVLRNSESMGGKSYLIHSVFAFAAAHSVAASSTASFAWGMENPPDDDPTISDPSTWNVPVRSLSGAAAGKSMALASDLAVLTLNVAGTELGETAGGRPYGVNGAVDAKGMCMEYRFSIPVLLEPRRIFGVTVCTVDPGLDKIFGGCGVRWYEVQL